MTTPFVMTDSAVCKNISGIIARIIIRDPGSQRAKMAGKCHIHMNACGLMRTHVDNLSLLTDSTRYLIKYAGMDIGPRIFVPIGALR